MDAFLLGVIHVEDLSTILLGDTVYTVCRPASDF